MNSDPSKPVPHAQGPTVVSVTRLGLQRDKRTYQNAASLSRFGYRSTVVEGEPSPLDRDQLPFGLITIEGAEQLREPDGADHEAAEATTDGEPAGTPSLGKRLRGAALRANGWWRNPLLLWRLHRRDNELTLASLPPADLYYLTFFWQFPAVWKACRRAGAGFIYDANDAYWLWPGYRWYPRLFRLWLRAVERRCVRRATAFVTVSEGVAELLERRYGRRPDVVRNLHDVRVDEDSDLDVRKASGLGDDDFLVVVVGNEKPSDAVAESLQALARLPDRVHMALLGAGYEKHDPLVRELGLERRVHMLAPVPPTEVTSAIRSADAGLINTRAREVHMHALPTRLFSTIAAGLPVLYPPLPEVRALAEAHGLGLPIDAEDPDAIADAVRRLSKDPELAAEKRANVERAREELNWEHEERLLARIVEQALRS